MKKFFKPIMTSALLSDDQELPTLDSFWYMTSHILKEFCPKNVVLKKTKNNTF